MLFSSKYSKMSFEERISLFKNLTASEVKSYINRKDLYSYDDFHEAPLNFAVKLSDINVVLELVKMGANAFSGVNRFANPAICDAIGANRPLSDIKLIAKLSKFKVDWDAENIAAYSCQIAASSRSDKRMLEFLYEQGVDLTKTHESELATFSAYSNAIENGPLENVEFLNSIGCQYPPRLRDFFKRIFYSDMSKNHREPWKTKIAEDSLCQLSSDRWKKIKFLVEKRVIEPHFLRDHMNERNFDQVFQDQFWLTIDPSVMEQTVRVIFGYAGEEASKDRYGLEGQLRATSGLEVEVIEELRDKRVGHVYGNVLKIKQRWLLDLKYAKTKSGGSDSAEQVASTGKIRIDSEVSGKQKYHAPVNKEAKELEPVKIYAQSIKRGIHSNAINHNSSKPEVSPYSISETSNSDDVYYEQALDELEQGNEKKDTYAKALTLCKGDTEQAKWRYVELRVEALKRDNTQS